MIQITVIPSSSDVALRIQHNLLEKEKMTHFLAFER
jgi:hypothetical protein